MICIFELSVSGQYCPFAFISNKYDPVTTQNTTEQAIVDVSP